MQMKEFGLRGASLEPAPGSANEISTSRFCTETYSDLRFEIVTCGTGRHLVSAESFNGHDIQHAYELFYGY